MDDLSISPWLLAGMFFLVSLAYSSVGLGGGSSYTALLTIFGASFRAIPTVSLAMNLVVTSVGTANYVRKGHLRLRLVGPFLVTSIPASYLGGTLDLPKDLFYWILLASLVFVAIRIYLYRQPKFEVRPGPVGTLALSLVAGVALGLLSGIVGIGGGIYLIPLVILLGLGTEKEAAACGSIFILVNSAAGLVARVQHHPVPLEDLLPLAGAAVLGGLVGSQLGASFLRPRTMQKILGGIVIVAIVLLARRVF